MGQTTKLGKKDFFILNFFHVLIDGLFESIPILLSFIVIAYGGGEKEVGLIVSMGMIICTLAGLSTVSFAERFSILQGTALVSLIYGVGYLLASLGTEFVFIGLAFVLASLGHNIFHDLSFTYLSRNVQRNSLGRAMSDFTAIGDIGRIPLVSLAGFAGAFSFFGLPGWRLTSFSYGVLTLVLALGLFIYSFSRKNISPTEKRKNPLRFPSLSLLKSKKISLSIMASGLNAFSCDRIFTFLPLLLIAKGFDPKAIGAFALGFTVGCFIGKLACGRLVDIFGTRKTFLSSAFILSLLLFILIRAEHISLIILTALLIGIVTKGSVPIIQTIITEHVQDKDRYSDIFSINSLGRGVINIITPVMFGFIAASFGINTIYALMLLGSLLSTLPVFILVRLDRKTDKAY